jgi:hypothetical protein
MGLAQFNPFKKDRQNFPGVVIPLADAPAHLTKLSETDDKESSKSLDHASSSENGVAGSHTSATHLTLEALRAEIEADLATASHDSTYDRMFPPLVVLHLDPALWYGCWGSWSNFLI